MCICALSFIDHRNLFTFRDCSDLLRPKFKQHQNMFVNVLVAAASATTTFFVSRRKSRRNGGGIVENKTKNFEQVRHSFEQQNSSLAGKNFKM